MAYDANRVTRDVDATFVPHGVVLEEARNVAETMGLPPWWLNEQASAYVSGQQEEIGRSAFWPFVSMRWTGEHRDGYG